MLRLTSCVLSLFLGCSTAAFSETINLGIISFDVLTPGNGISPGVNVFNITNLTGDPLLSGFALPSDFPVFTSVIIMGATLTLEDGGAPTVIGLSAIDPGPFLVPGSLQFPDTVAFTSVILSATLNQTSLLLADGTTFLTDSALVLVTMLPFVDPSLVAGSDFAVISVTGSVAAAGVPEPRSAGMMMAALGLAFVVTRKGGLC